MADIEAWLEGQPERIKDLAAYFASITPPEVERACPHDGKLFTGHPSKVYCSKACRQRAWRRRTKPRRWLRTHGGELEEQDPRWRS